MEDSRPTSSSLLPVPYIGTTGISIPAALVESAKAYASKSRSANTTKAYAGDWKRFTTWCDSVGVDSLPVPVEGLILYLTHRADQGKKPSVIARELTAISIAHRMAGYVLPRNDPMVKEVMSGIRRTKKSPPRQASPLTPADLKKIAAMLPPTLTGQRDLAILTLGFAGAFRVSELSSLRIEDLVFSDDGLAILLRSSKTDQEGKGEMVGIPWGNSKDLCPVRAVKAWLAASHLKKGFLFRGMWRGDNLQIKPFGPHGIAAMIHQRAEEAGIDLPHVSGHSLRAGFATTAARKGKSMPAIQRQTRHKSIAMVAHYVQRGTLFDDNAASGIGL